MILRPLQSSHVESEAWRPAWWVVEGLQRKSYESCWMITQPSHAALAGEMAAALTGKQVPRLDHQVIQAIALHDAGWGPRDAQDIVSSRSLKQSKPQSFLQVPVAELVTIWQKSIDAAQNVGPVGGCIVSQHFCRIADQALSAGHFSGADQPHAERFLQRESTRRKALQLKQHRTSADLDQLTEVLQFCDLLSLYACSGAEEPVEFPAYFGVRMKVKLENGNYRLDPPLIDSGQGFKVAALRYPAQGQDSSRQIVITIA